MVDPSSSSNPITNNHAPNHKQAEIPSRDGLIATLASIFEDRDCEELEAALRTKDSNLEATIDYLISAQSRRPETDPTNLQSQKSARQRSPDNFTSNKKSKSSSLQSWLSCPTGSRINQPADHPNTTHSGAGDQKPSTWNVASQRVPESQLKSSTTPDFPIFKQAPSSRPIKEALSQSSPHSSSPKPTKRTTLPPLFLSSPQQISEHLPCCSLLHGILPKQLAWNLYERMIKDCQGDGISKKPWIRNRWWLADREVQSPHSTAFFITKPTDSESLVDDYNESAQYWYAGKPLEADAQPRYFSDEMDEARHMIESIVNLLLINDPETLLRAQRSSKSNPITRYDQEWDGPWRANVAASNCYRGSKENVGWHADQLTYLGPYPTIASLSLGTTRQFRLRPVANILETETAEPLRTYSMSLPHNSLLVMHGGCQERYKHCIPPQPSLDVFKNPLQPTDTRIERINITFRFYRPDFRPSRSIPIRNASSSSLSSGPNPNQQDSTEVCVTPRCRCGIPAILRADQKGKVAASRARPRLETSASTTADHAEFQFFWHCQAGQQNSGKGCNFFQILNFQAERRGPCIGDQNENK
ncbi:hypothetical protein PGT21_006404 [Puccinia graminis f. sp. tritici]|uniref:Fe2OG dioxygenase domain-containing protein n=1 Tax=Puccinia graminis f. sp. tritici TaxID=56615 RepID=A0A5B0RCV6_PUCGR|nr:hypothetical protein PGT21_006404 [Puccinia graminis f. sp. tritici]KAA1123209.1 hypothetical protein PGTUg99_007456 [Puccinia graminis f. sp. tritici]